MGIWGYVYVYVYMYTYKADSPCYTAETNTPL